MSAPAFDSPGAHYLGNNACHFEVWAPFAKTVEVHLLGPKERLVPLTRREHGYHAGQVDGVAPGRRYFFRLDGKNERPDPASCFQPDGVHGPSQVCDPHFDWRDGHWFGLPLERYVCYELHVGTFTPEGTFDAVISRLDELRDLGVTAINIMPVAQFPGSRNWGYDGVYLYAVQNSYGGPDGLKRLVDACHARGLAAILDVVYNHLGPEGSYLGEYGPYFTDRYKTPWGSALNYDGPESDAVRRFFLGNAWQWQTQFHFDALRLDAVHAILDHSAFPFLQELGARTALRAQQLNRQFHLISESSLNDDKVLRPAELGGWGHAALWNDDFHHAVHTLLTGEANGYYADFGRIEHLARAWRDGFSYSGQYSPFRRRRHGNSARNRPARQFVVCAQNHDQIGNRMLGDRLTTQVDFEGLKLAAAVVILSPYIPLLFMGEEYGETAPFQFFVSHGDTELIENVRKGRRREFESFGWQGEVPDPQAETTFERCRLDNHLKETGTHKVLYDFYKKLLALRRAVPALAFLSKEHQEVLGFERHKAMFVRRWYNGDEVAMLFNFSAQSARVELPIPAGEWRLLLDSAAKEWQGNATAAATLTSPGWVEITVPPRSVLAYRK